MSRIGKRPVPVPAGVEVSIEGKLVQVKGPKGRLTQELPNGIEATLAPEKKEVIVRRSSEDRRTRACHGLARQLIANMMQGVTQGYSKSLEVHGVGYNIRLQGRTLVMQLGFANPIQFPIPDGIEIEVQSPTNPGRMVVRGCDKQLVGQVAAAIRAIRPPEPYQGKGIRYADEIVRRKAGKAFTSG